jgi:hypothetical protein
MAHALEALLRDEPADRTQLSSWYERAHSISEKIRSDAGLCKDVPEIVWHYLSDADIRLRDERYAKAQRVEVAAVIAAFKTCR